MNDTDRNIALKELILNAELDRRKANKGSLESFIRYLNSNYNFLWFNKRLMFKIESFLKDESKKCLAVFMPPQHGKSEISSRYAPAFALGINPDLKIAIASYAADLAVSFNRNIQTIIDSDYYRDIFPGTRINSKNVVTTQSWLRNSEVFEVINRKGRVQAVGVGSGLTGKTVDLMIIDDPIKDYQEANSKTTRDNVWFWYLSVVLTRLHNKSKQILIMTRWHQDDLAGRLLDKKMNPFWDQWEIVMFKAICEEHTDGDPRDIGEALWPSRHNLEKLNILKELDVNTFNSLYQQDPIQQGGNIFKKSWFDVVDTSNQHLTLDLWIDGAYTKSTSNDPSGFLITGYDTSINVLYIMYADDRYLPMPDLLKSVGDLYSAFGLGPGSRIYIEPKASGKSLSQLINTWSNIPSIEINNYLVNEGKEARAYVASPYCESGKVKLIKGNWNDKFVNQLTSFPKGKHDEFIDLLGYACYHYFQPGKNINFWDRVYSKENLM